MKEMLSAVHIQDAVVEYRHGRALDQISLDIGAGECVGLLGPNGAGKSTLLTVINGLTALSRGAVRTLGLNPASGREARKIRTRVGYVAQHSRIDPRLPINVRETVSTGRFGKIGWLGRMKAADREAVDKALEWTGLTELAGRPVGHLSGGQLQRTAIARVLAQEPELLLLDEPTASIDPGVQEELLQLLETLPGRTGAAMICVTHDIRALPEVCRRIVLIQAGRIWRSGGRQAMTEDALLNTLYGNTALKGNAG